jgi:hypothetical protein
MGASIDTKPARAAAASGSSRLGSAKSSAVR